jgi:ADP-ribose pyrophosphatase
MKEARSGASLLLLGYDDGMTELYNGHGWKVILEESPLLNGGTKQTARAYRCDSVHIVAVPKPGHVLLLREYRPHYAEWVWMLPSGKMDKQDELDPRVAAQRELQEETGFRATHLEPLFMGRPGEALAQKNHLFVATGLSPAPLEADPDEQIEVHEMTVQEAIEKVLATQPVHTLTLSGLLAYHYRAS